MQRQFFFSSLINDGSIFYRESAGMRTKRIMKRAACLPWLFTIVTICGQPHHPLLKIRLLLVSKWQDGAVQNAKLEASKRWFTNQWVMPRWVTTWFKHGGFAVIDKEFILIVCPSNEWHIYTMKCGPSKNASIMANSFCYITKSWTHFQLTQESQLAWPWSKIT